MKFAKTVFALWVMFVALCFMVPFFVAGVLFQFAFGAFVIGRKGAENMDEWLKDATKNI